MCVTHLHGVYCDGVFPYLLVMANFVYMWEVYNNIIMSFPLVRENSNHRSIKLTGKNCNVSFVITL